MASNTRNLAYNYAGVLTTIVVGFLMTPLLIRGLGIEAFGAVGILVSLTSWAQLLDLGIGLAGMKLISEYSLPEGQEPITRIASSVLAAYAGLSVVVGIVGLALTPLLATAFNVPADLQNEFRAALMLSMATLAITLSSASLTGMLQGIGDFKRLNLAVMGQALASSVGGVIVATTTHSLLAVTAWGTVVVIAMAVTKWSLLRARGVRPTVRRADRTTMRHVLTFSSATFVISVGSRMIFQTDALVVGAFASSAAVGIFMTASNPALGLRRMGEQLTSVVLTSSSRLHALGRKQELRELVTASMKYSALVLVPFIAAVAVLAHDFLSTWVGRRFEPAAPALVILTCAVVVYGIQIAPAQVLLTTGRQRTLARVVALEAVINLVVSIALVGPLGITGVALATLLPSLAVACTFTVPLAFRDLGLPARSLWACCRSAVLSTAVAGALLWALERSIAITSLLEVVALGVGFLVVYAGLVIVLDREVRSYARAAAQLTPS